MPKKESTNSQRLDAFSKLKLAQKMIAEGRAELSAAEAKIKRAQVMIDQSADTIRATGRGKRS